MHAITRFFGASSFRWLCGFNQFAPLRRETGFLVVALLLGIVQAPRAAEQQVLVKYQFDAPNVTAAGDYAHVTVGSCSPSQRAGQPEVPFRTAKILLPPGATVVRVEATLTADAETYAVERPLTFGRTAVPIGVSDHPAVARAALDRPDDATYGADDAYPASRAELVSVQKMNGYSVAIVRVFPVQYLPVSGKLLFAPELAVTVTTDDGKAAVSALFVGSAAAGPTSRVAAFVDNPESLVSYESVQAQTVRSLQAYDYLLITKASLTNSFDPLISQKIADGLSVKVATVESVVAGYSGVDDAAKIRTFITYAYTNWNTQYVLLGGDISTVPYRKAYAYCSGADTNMPCDLYFACLDGSWNSDGDGYWGEPTDGEGGGDVDLLAEVYVGRAPVDTAAEVSNFVAKTVYYEQNGHANANKARFLGEYLGNYDGTYSQGGDGLDPLLPSFSDYQVDWLDDRPTDAQTWYASNCVSVLNESPHLVAHDGHANETYAMRMVESNIDGLTNAAPFLVNSVGCYCGAFDYSDCFAEELVKRNRYGAFAVLMNSRYGWFNSDYEWMFSGEFMACFFNELLEQGKLHVGEANQLAKHDMIGSVETTGDMVYRWCYFEITLFGDPHVPLQGWDGFQLSPAEAFEASGYVNGPFSPTGQVYTISNVGAAALSWSLTHSPTWLSASPEGGALGAGATGQVVVAINALANTLPVGEYTDTLVFSNTVSGLAKTRFVRLTVQGDIRFSASNDTQAEAGGVEKSITVVRSGHTNLAATVDFAATAGTATAGVDFIATNGTLAFAAGETHKTFKVEILDDAIVEPDETVLLTLSNPTGGATLGDPSTATLTLEDDDTSIVGQLTTTFEGGNSSYGNMFDILPKKEVSIEALDVNMAAAAGLSVSADIYYRVGSSFGYETNNLAWTLVATKTVTSAGSGLPTHLDLSGSGLVFSAGQKYGLYVHCSAGLTYTTGSNTYEDASIQLVANCGKGTPAFTGSTFTPRIWNGTVTYVPVTSDGFYVCPATGLTATGYEGGPFSPWYKTYMLTNTSASGLTWTSSKPGWITVSPASGSLAAGASGTVTVSINANAQALAAGSYSDAVIFSNTVSGCALSRTAALTVQAIPGEISVSDSIAPDSDLNMPFGPVIVGLSRTETVTVSNTDPARDLVIADVRSPTYEENFDDGLAQGWEPDNASYWSVEGGEYVAQGSVSAFMVSSYSGHKWRDVAVQTSVRQTGTAGYTSALFFRATDDFSLDASGSAYGVGVSSGYFWVGKWIDGSMTWLTDGWVESPYLYDSAETNWVAVCAQGSAIAVYFNGYKAWEGTDSSITAEGRIALGGYSTGATVHRFDNVTVGVSVTGVLMGETEASKTVQTAADESTDIRCAPGGFSEKAVEPLLKTDSVGVKVISAFKLIGLPSLPVSLHPGSNLTFSVAFAPPAIGTHESQVVIESNDKDEPEVTVALSGEGIPDYLSVSPETGLSGSGHPGGPFSPSSQGYVVSNNSAVTINWAIASHSDWVTAWPDFGSLAAGASTSIMVAFNANAAALAEGSYDGALVFSNKTTTVSQSRDMALDVFTAPTVLVAPTSIIVTNLLGHAQTKPLQVGNAAWADADLNFSLGVSEVSRNVLAASSSSAVKRDFTRLDENADYRAGELLVRFEDDVAQAGTAQARVLANAGGGTVARRFTLVTGLAVVQLPEGLTMADALVQFNQTAGIRYAQPNYLQHAFRTPNDPYFSYLWGMNSTSDVDIDAPEAWDVGVGGPAVTVAVIDTGVDYTHQDLAANIWRNPGEIAGNGIDDDNNGYVDDMYGYDFCNGDADPMDDHGHGTHCSGTIGAVGDNGIGVAGVCWNVRIMALKFLDSTGSGYTADAIGCIEYAVQMGARVLSNSWGGGDYEQALKDAIDAAGAADVLFVAAAGNDYGNDNDTNPVYPASYDSDNIISVMSVASTGAMSDFSNFGATTVDLAAPGSGILSCQPGNNYQFMSGTSMATPHVSGACALLLSLDSGLSCQQVKNILIETADSSLSGFCVAGGLMRLGAAVAYAPAWLRADPVSGAGVVPGAWSDIAVAVDAGRLAAGTYAGVINIRCNDRDTPVTNVPVTMVVLQDNLGILQSEDWIAEGFAGGPFTPSSKVYTLTNAGVSSLSWTAGGADMPWVSISPTSGVLAAGDSVQVAASFNSQTATLPYGDYSGLLVFSNATSSAVQRRTVELCVHERVFTHFEWGGVTSTQYVGEPFGVTISAIDNAGSVFSAFTNSVNLYAVSAAVTNQEVVSGTNAWNYPLSTWYHDARTQVIYPKDEVGSGGLLTGLSLYVTKVPGQEMKTWTIRLKHTPFSSYSTRAWQTNDWTVALQTNMTISTTGWVKLDFGTPFAYNGISNLLVDFSFNNSSYTSDGYCLCKVTSASRSLFYRTDSGYGDPLTWTGSTPLGTLSTNVPAVRFEKRDIVPVVPSVTGLFVGGVWSGNLMLSDLATNVLLLASDGAGHKGLSAPFNVIISLPEALDNAVPTWTTGGSSAWFGQRSVAYDGVDAARSGPVGNRQSSWLSAQVSGPGEAAFWWRVSSEADWDWLEFYVDDVLADRISGESGWLHEVQTLASGTHTLKWRFVKDGADLDPVGQDCGWVDRFVGPVPNALLEEWLWGYGLPSDGSADYGDADGDGLNNWAEWVSGTVPTNSLSVLQLTDAVPDSGEGGFRIRWQSVAGKYYWLESCDALGPSAVFTPFVSNVLGEAGSTEVIDTRPSAEGARFYRVGVQQ